MCALPHTSLGDAWPQGQKAQPVCWHRAMHTSCCYGALLPHTHTHTHVLAVSTQPKAEMWHTYLGMLDGNGLDALAKERQMEMVSKADDQILVSRTGAGRWGGRYDVEEQGAEQMMLGPFLTALSSFS